MYDLISGEVMGYASPVPVQNKSGPGGNSNDGGKDPQLWYMGSPPPIEYPSMYGYEPIDTKEPRNEILASHNFTKSIMGGK